MAKKKITGSDLSKTGRKHNPRTKGSNSNKKGPDLDFSELKLRWEEELSYYIAANKYKIYKEKLPSGNFEYRVRDEYGEMIFSIESARNVVFGPRRQRRRNKRRR